MVGHEELVGSVRVLGGLGDIGEARAVVGGVVGALARCLSVEARAWLAQQLPGAPDDGGPAPGRAEPRRGTEFVTDVAHRLGTTSERARQLAQAVLAALHRADPHLASQLRDRLPEDVADVLVPVGEPPWRVASARSGFSRGWPPTRSPAHSAR